MHTINELRELAERVQEKKGRMDAAQKRIASEILASLLASPDQDPIEPLQVAENLQAEAIADGIAEAWPRIPNDRQLKILRWLPAPQSERAQRRVSSLAVRVSENDGDTALELIDRLLPDTHIGKELQSLLTATLFNSSRCVNFDKLASSNRSSVTRVLGKLTRFVFDPNRSIEIMVRYKLVTAVVAQLRSALSESNPNNDLLRQVVTEVERWPTNLRTQFDSWVKENAPTLAANFFPLSQAGQSKSAATPQTVEIQGAERNGPTSSIDHYLRSKIESLEGEWKALSNLRISLKDASDRERSLSAEAKLREQKLTLAIAELESSRSSLQRELETTRKELRDLQERLHEAEIRLGEDRTKLTQQITANANGRINEFQHQVAITVAKHLSDLPARGTEVSPELGRVLLLQLYQLIEVLAQLGIVLPTRNISR